MRLVLLILGAVVAQVWHEDDPQDDATRQLWFEETREAVLPALHAALCETGGGNHSRSP